MVIPVVDTVVIATGVKSDQSLLDELREFADKIVIAGDAKATKDGYHNIREGFEAGLMI